MGFASKRVLFVEHHKGILVSHRQPTLASGGDTRALRRSLQRQHRRTMMIISSTPDIEENNMRRNIGSFHCEIDAALVGGSVGLVGDAVGLNVTSVGAVVL